MKKTTNSYSATTPSKPLDDAYYSAQAMYSEMYNKAKEKGDSTGMRDANDNMNMVRNEYGLAAQYANEDIAKVEREENAKKKAQAEQQRAQAAQERAQAEQERAQAAADYNNYLQQMYEAQKKTALAQLNSAVCKVGIGKYNFTVFHSHKVILFDFYIKRTEESVSKLG